MGIASAAAGMLAAAQVTAVAATDATDAITGVEVSASSSQGTFVGTAGGDLPGAWRAVVRHAALPRRVGAHAAITGGTFALSTVVGGDPVTVKGSFRRNARGITLLDAGSGCHNQVYRIRDRLTRLGISTRDGKGSLTARLTHYRLRILGHCITYSASVSGTVRLMFG